MVTWRRAVKLYGDSLRWQVEVREEAMRRHWSVYMQTRVNQRQRDPSLLLVRRSCLLAVYLRLNVRADRRPPVEELEQMAGARVVLWTPDDRAEMLEVLTQS